MQIFRISQLINKHNICLIERENPSIIIMDIDILETQIYIPGIFLNDYYTIDGNKLNKPHYIFSLAKNSIIVVKPR